MQRSAFTRRRIHAPTYRYLRVSAYKPTPAPTYNKGTKPKDGKRFRIKERIQDTGQTHHQQTQQTFKKQYTMQHEQEIKKTPNHIDRHEIHKKSPKLPKQKSQNSSKKKHISGAP